MNIERIIVAMPATEEHRSRLRESAPNSEFIFLDDSAPSSEQLACADVIIGSIPPSSLEHYKRLKLLQLSMAGSDSYAKLVPPDAILANASGAYGLAISEHMLAMLLSLMKKLDLYAANQRDCLWQDEGTVRSIENARVLTIGLGDIGGQFARRCKLLGAYCIGIKRSIQEKPSYIDELYTMDSLDSVLPMADVVALSLPNSPESYHIMDAERLNKMKNGGVLLNVGRGNAIDTDALVDALMSGRIKAGLDVTDPEPLPIDHPLWKCKGAMITPHVSGYYHLKQTHDNIIEIAADNLYRLINNLPIKNIVDPQTGYRRLEDRA